MDKSNCGVIYYATGKNFLREANNSARSVKEKLEGIKTAIFTDGMYKSLLDENLFDYVIFREKQVSPKLGRITCLAESPFEKTLFLDTDTEVLEPVWELFEILEKFDLALTHAPFRASTLSIAMNRALDAIVRLPMRTSQPEIPIGVVSKSYRLVHQKEVLNAALTALVSAGIDLDKTTAELRITELGERSRICEIASRLSSRKALLRSRGPTILTLEQVLDSHYAPETQAHGRPSEARQGQTDQDRPGLPSPSPSTSGWSGFAMGGGSRPGSCN